MGKNELILGIDLGTTTSEACIYRNDNPKMLRNESTNDITPSVLGIDPKTKMLEVGESAKSLGQSNPKDVLHEVKRYMNDDDVENIKLPLGNKKLSPTEASAEILKYIKKYSEESVGQEINIAVITVPANFSSKAREATKKAGEKAGFKVERIINEPTAAALAYCMDNTTEEDFVKIMIYDLGGGTFDVSIGEFHKGVLEIIGGAGDMKLGGKDFDRLLSEYLGLKPYKANGFTAQILVSMPDPETGELIEYSVSRINPTKDTVNARLVSNPKGGITKLSQNEIIINKNLKPSWINYTDPLTKKALGSFDAVRCLNNSVFVTIVATIITLLINSMAAFALSKYRFNGQIVFFVIILAAFNSLFMTIPPH